jgi:D-alanyl-D-alanine carboxypeptidase (penicillin-binding protein 5/6)
MERKRFKFFLIGLTLSLVFTFAVNGAEKSLETFFINEVYFPPNNFLAQVSKENFLKKESFNLNIEAKSALVVKIEADGRQTVIFDKDSDQPLPIASLTKLMTVLVSLESQPLSQKIEITPQIISQPGSSGGLKTGERISVKELIKMALVESSNDAADALAEVNGRDNFVNLMNLKAKEIGLRSTRFSTPTGLEAEDNFSTARDITNLTFLILKRYSLILDISSQPSITILSENDKPHHIAFNTNDLLALGEIEGLKIVGGKTGYTDEAGGCITLVLKDQDNNYFINVILGASSQESRFSEMRKLIEAFNVR